LHYRVSMLMLNEYSQVLMPSKQNKETSFTHQLSPLSWKWKMEFIKRIASNHDLVCCHLHQTTK
jgi:hypothetical protein